VTFLPFTYLCLLFHYCISSFSTYIAVTIFDQNLIFKESQVSVTEARKKRQEISQRLKEDSQREREEVENKLLEITAICRELESEKNCLVLRQQEKMLSDNANASKVCSSLINVI
jgi:hypothetical protein